MEVDTTRESAHVGITTIACTMTLTFGNVNIVAYLDEAGRVSCYAFGKVRYFDSAIDLLNFWRDNH